MITHFYVHIFNIVSIQTEVNNELEELIDVSQQIEEIEKVELEKKEKEVQEKRERELKKRQTRRKTGILSPKKGEDKEEEKVEIKLDHPITIKDVITPK
jgi:hypothetical protein